MFPFRRSQRPAPQPRLGTEWAPERITPLGFDHLELYVGNPEHTVRLLADLGFSIVARQGPETGVQDQHSYVLRQGDVTLLVTGGLTPAQDAVRHVAVHGDSIKDVAITALDVDGVYGTCVNKGVEPEHLPVEYDDDDGRLGLCPVGTPTGLLHSFIDRSNYAGAFCPGFLDESAGTSDASGVTRVASVTLVVRPGTLDEVAAFYRRVLAVDEVARDDLDVGRETDAEPASVCVLSSEEAAIVLILIEPHRRRSPSHLDGFLRLHQGPGVQVVTFEAEDPAAVASRWSEAGLAPLLDEESVAGIHTTEPLQRRTPLLFEVVAADSPAWDLGAIARRHATLDRMHRAVADTQLLGTWQAGR